MNQQTLHHFEEQKLVLKKPKWWWWWGGPSKTKSQVVGEILSVLVCVCVDGLVPELSCLRLSC